MEPRKRKITKHGNERWELDFGIDSTGLKKRKVVLTEADADKEIDAYLKAVKTRGEWWARLTELEREAVQTVCKQVQASGFTLSRIWEDHQRWRKENAQTAIDTMRYGKAVGAWKERKLAAGKSEDYVEEAVAVLMRFGMGREEQNIHEITAAELQAWLNAQMKPGHGGPATGTWGLSSKKTNTSLFSSLASPLRFVPLRKTAETGDSPGQRITGPSSGNARRLAGLRCGLGHALAPNVSLTSGRQCSALGLTAHPSTLEPRPGATHSRPEVRWWPTRKPMPPDCEPSAQLSRHRAGRSERPAESRSLAAGGN